MLMALQQLLALMTPYEDVPSLRLLLGAIATAAGHRRDPRRRADLGGAFERRRRCCWSMSLAAKGVVPPDAAFALVLGANLGTAHQPAARGRRRRRPGRAARCRSAICSTALVGCVARRWRCSNWIGPLMVTLEPDPARAVADFHTGFNLVVAALFLPLLGPFARLLRMAAAGAGGADRPVAAALSRRGGARDAGDRAGRRRARGAAHGRRAGGDAARRARRARPRRPQADQRGPSGSTTCSTGSTRAIKAYLTALDPDALDDADHRRLARDPRLHHQPRACRRHRRQRLIGDRREAPEARPAFSDEGQARDPRDARAAGRQRPRRRRGVHDRRRRAPRAACSARRRCSATWRRARPRRISPASAPGGSRASRPARCISTCCAT